MKNNIFDYIITEKGSCCGCAVCVDACSQGAIHMIEDEMGFLYPSIDKNKCVQCKACVSMCPINNQPSFHNRGIYYSGFSNDIEKLNNSSSGAAAAELYLAYISKGGCVAGVKYSSDFTSAEYVLIKDSESVCSLSGSKYIQTNKKNIYKQVKEEIKKNNRVLFIGLPCEVAAIRKMIHNDELLYTAELVCHGPTSPRVEKEYVDSLTKENGKIVSFNLRDKTIAWEQPALKAVFEDGKEFIKDFYSTEYGLAFSFLLRESCYNCKFKGSQTVADLTLADCWGVQKNSDFYNEKGVSLIISNTPNGDSLIEILKDNNFHITKIDKELIKNHLMFQPIEKNWIAKEYEKYFKRGGIFNAYKKMHSLKFRIKNFIKKRK